MLHRGDATDGSLNLVANQVRSIAAGAGRAKTTKRATPTPSTSNANYGTVAAARKADSDVSKMPALKAKKTDIDAVLDESHVASPPRKPRDDPSQNMWAKMAKRDAEEYHHDIVTYRRSLKRKEAEQRVYLDQQVKVRKDAVVVARDAEGIFAVEEDRQRVAWEADEIKIEAIKKKRHVDEKKSRDEQLVDMKQRRAREVIVRRVADEQSAVRDRDGYVKEQELIKERRIHARVEVAKAQSFNQEFKLVKAAEKEKERLQDIEHQRMFLERLAQQEGVRELTLVKMQEKQKVQQQIAFQLQSTVADRAAIDEVKANEYYYKLQAKHDAEEASKKAHVEAEKIKHKQYLTVQMIEREERRKAERDQVIESRQDVLKELAKSERKQHETIVKSKEKAQQHRHAIEDQIVSHAARHELAMTDTERKLNNSRLRKSGLM
jgi:hypothetical protein